MGLPLTHDLAQNMTYRRGNGCDETSFRIARTGSIRTEANMELAEETHGSVVVTIARGRLDGSTSEMFGGWLERFLSVPEPRIVIDFAGIEFLTSAGLRVILTAMKRVRTANGILAICSVQANVQEVLEITGFAGLLRQHSTRAEAIAALA